MAGTRQPEAKEATVPAENGGVGSGTVHFDVSTGLKRVLGRELITNDEVAIFEMVKNSFDAGAKHVHLHFAKDSIIVADDGSGMSYDDLLGKWLFVAYSAKRDGAPGTTFRDKAAERTHYAGNKGIGRFSSDSLGDKLTLQTRREGEKNRTVHKLTVDWSRFELDDKEHFERVPVDYSQATSFDLPSELEKFRPKLLHGTIIRIEALRKEWSREELLSLKGSLAKLINPFGSDMDQFSIHIIAPLEHEKDKGFLSQATARNELPYSKDVVNGRVGNFIFSELQKKTTFLRVEIFANEIKSMLTDRGELIYEIVEPNIYPLLRSAGFHCEIYYLNQSAKVTFTRRLGLPSVQFGSLFLFRNGFRVFPIGNDGDDWFGFDRRKTQGYNRFLGTREVIGRVDVSGAGQQFQEASSRDAGLIDTSAVRELRRAVLDHCLKRLERYVVPVSWKDKLDAQADDLSRLRTDPGRARVTMAVASLVDNDDVRLVRYSKDLISLLNERSSEFESSLDGLRAIAEKTRDRKFLREVEAAEKRFAELRRSEADATRIADEERAAGAEATQRAERAEAETENERRRASFLETVVNVDTATILNLHHQVTIYAVDIAQQIENLLASTAKSQSISRELLLKAVEQIAFLNRKILSITRFASRATFQLESEKIEADLPSFIEDYIGNIVQVSSGGRLDVTVENHHPGLMLRFNPIDISIVIDNLISNSRRARASSIAFRLSALDKGGLLIQTDDDGDGLGRGVDSERIFEMGYSTTSGSGLGLYHVRQVLGEMGGTVQTNLHEGNSGVGFVIRIAGVKKRS